MSPTDTIYNYLINLRECRNGAGLTISENNILGVCIRSRTNSELPAKKCFEPEWITLGKKAVYHLNEMQTHEDSLKIVQEDIQKYWSEFTG